MAAERREGARRLLWAGLLGSGLLALALYATYGIEWVEQSIDLGYGEEALRNRYLAAELFLREQGVEAETVSGMTILESLPPVGDALVITSTRRAMSERRVEGLTRWIEEGGHLVVVAREPWDEATGGSLDPLLSRYGVHLVAPSEEEPGEDLDGNEEESEEAEGGTGAEELSAEAHEEELEEEFEEELERKVGDLFEEVLSGALPACWEDEEPLAVLYSPEATRALQLELWNEHHLDASLADDAVALGAMGEHGAQLVHIPAGEGRLTAATSLEIWTNHRIHCRDHAYLLWLLTLNSDKVWLLHDPDIPSLAALLGAKLPLTCSGVAVLLLLWAAAASLRFGPAIPDAGGERRELLEHLEASAHFLWRRGLLAGALDELREEIALRAAAQHAAWPRLAPSERVAHLAELAGRPEQEVRAAFEGAAPSTRRELVHTMQILHAIRRKL